MLSVQQLLNVCMIWERFTKKKNGFHISYQKMPFRLNVCISLIARQKKEEFFYIELLLWMKNGVILIIPNKKNYVIIKFIIKLNYYNYIINPGQPVNQHSFQGTIFTIQKYCCVFGIKVLCIMNC